MKTENDIKEYSLYISKRLDSLYCKFQNKEITEKEFETLREVLEIREDLLCWILEE